MCINFNAFLIISRDLETKKDCITQSLLSKLNNIFHHDRYLFVIVKCSTFADVWNSDSAVINELTPEVISKDVTRALKE